MRRSDRRVGADLLDACRGQLDDPGAGQLEPRQRDARDVPAEVGDRSATPRDAQVPPMARELTSTKPAAAATAKSPLWDAPLPAAFVSVTRRRALAPGAVMEDFVDRLTG